MQRNPKPSGKDPRYDNPPPTSPPREGHYPRSHQPINTATIQFWKQFFEASANVALSNYQEEEAYDDPTVNTTHDDQTYATHESSAFPNSSPGHYEERSTRLGLGPEEEIRHTTPGGDEEEGSGDDDYLLDDSLLDSLNLTGAAIQSTPKAKQPQGKDGRTAQWADIESPFEALKKELTMKDYTVHGFPPQSSHHHNIHDEDEDEDVLPPSTPPSNRPRPNRLRLPPGIDPETPESSPFYPPQTTGRKTPGNPNEDALLHRVLDKNWRVQATPLGKAPASKYRSNIQPTNAATPKSTRKLFTPNSASPMSSPPKPHLHTAHIFSSPSRGNVNMGPKTPTTGKQKYDHNDWDEEDSDELLLPPGYSPPRTIQFSFPSSKLLATPAREASRRIVKDILMTAGAADESNATDSSPPVVRGRAGDYDDTF